MARIALAEPAPPTMKNSLRFGLLDRGEDADALVVVVVPQGVEPRRGLQQVGGDALPALRGEVGGLARPDREPVRLRARRAKPWLRSWVSGRLSMPAISPMTGLVTPAPRSRVPM